MRPAADLAACLGPLVLLPRQLRLDTPGVRATVPMLRGVWGAALHGLDPTAYRDVFAPPEGGPPPSYLLRPAPPDPQTAPAVDWFLFGPALDHEESLRRAWDVASGMGLGPDRQRFYLRQLVPLGPDGQPARRSLSWSLRDVTWPLPGPPAVTPCRLGFPAPLRLLRYRKLIEQPTLADLTVAAWRRVRAFLPEEGVVAWDGWQPELLEAARQRPASGWRGTRLDLQRWSARQQAEVELRGVSGSLELPDGPGELWPLLAAAMWLHLGKGTTVGLGELQILPLPA